MAVLIKEHLQGSPIRITKVHIPGKMSRLACKLELILEFKNIIFEMMMTVAKK